MQPDPEAVDPRAPKVPDRPRKGVRGWLYERIRRWWYEHPVAGTRWRKFMWKWRNPHCEVIFEGPVSIGPRCTLYMPLPATLRVGPNVQFRRGCHLELNPFSELTIGEGTIMTYNVVIQTVRKITIGKRCLIGTGCVIVDGKHNFRGDELTINEQGLDFEPLTMGDDVLVNVKATVAADVGERAVIAAHAVVTKPIPPWTLAGGLPAKPLAKLGTQKDMASQHD
jgi:acetyltransferase-like isoleucine patch superfamily enzyme